MFAKSIVAMALFAGAVVAQNTTIDPNTVSATMRSQWCAGQQNTCGTLCSGDVGVNKCDPNTLSYNCTCSANNSAPGLQYYKETMPTFICETVYSNCITAGQNDQAAQNKCKAAEASNCGHLDPANFTAAAATTSAASTSATATATDSTASGTAAPSSTSKAAAPTLAAVRTFGTGAVAVGVAAAFGYML